MFILIKSDMLFSMLVFRALCVYIGISTRLVDIFLVYPVVYRSIGRILILVIH